MNVDVAIVGLSVLRFESAQPENAGHNGIATRRIGRHDFAREAPAFKDRAAGRAVADFAGNFQIA